MMMMMRLKTKAVRLFTSGVNLHVVMRSYKTICVTLIVKTPTGMKMSCRFLKDHDDGVM